MDKKTSHNTQAEDEFRAGQAAWHAGDMATAISHYEKAAALDPEGPAAVALDYARDIINFYNTDQFNP